MSEFDRRKFVKKLGFGFLGVSLISFSPLKIFANNNKNTKKVNIKINPIAVKRTNIK